ncbi:MAG: DsbA family protein [Pseudomonadota bacterium]
MSIRAFSLAAACVVGGLAAAALTLGSASQADEAKPEGSGAYSAEAREALREEIRAFLMEEPELVEAAIFELRRKREAEEREHLARVLPQFLPEVEALVAKGERVLVQGDADGDVTIIELTDYNCGFCKRLQGEIAALIERDPKVRHVVKAVPYFGSPFPEQAIVAASLQGDQAQITEFHQMMMESDGLDDQQVLQIAEVIGFDVDKLVADMESPEVEGRLRRTLGIFQSLGFQGTPAVIYPDRVGAYAPTDELAAIVSEIRESR